MWNFHVALSNNYSFQLLSITIRLKHRKQAAQAIVSNLPVILLPPSASGFVHTSDTLLAVTWLTSSFPGALGTSDALMASVVSHAWPIPWSFSAMTRK